MAREGLMGEEPMSDERLAHIERVWSQPLNRDHPFVDAACRQIPELIAEIRRLRRRLPLVVVEYAPMGRG